MSSDKKLTDIDELIADVMQVRIGGFDYEIRYPTTEDIEKKIKALKGDTEKIGEWFISLITPLKEGTPAIEETLKKVTPQKSRKLVEIIQDEMGI